MSLGMSWEIASYNDYIVMASGFFVPEPQIWRLESLRGLIQTRCLCMVSSSSGCVESDLPQYSLNRRRVRRRAPHTELDAVKVH